MSLKKILISAVLTAFISVPLYAASEKEMEEARTYALQAYLRYANDASGYLDEISVKTVADLKSKLKAQELENIKGAEAVALPKDYASWDKTRLSEYWSQAFFASPGLLEKGRHAGAKARVKRKIEAMTVTAGAAKTEEPKQSEEAMGDPLDGIGGAEPSAATAPAEADALTDSIDQTAKRLEEALAEEEALSHKSSNSYTWVYIAILAVLVGVVIWLVIFASRVMKRNEERRQMEEDERERRPESRNREAEADLRRAAAESDALRARFDSAVASKDNEIRELRRGADILREENLRMRTETEGLRSECDRLRTENSRLRGEIERMKASPAPTQATAPSQHVAASSPSSPVAQQAPASTAPRTIFLGRANARSLFVRADRKLNIGHSVFRLDTADGFAGTFRVAADPAVWEVALLNPIEQLAGACSGPDLDQTAGMNRIVTDSPGTAIFENGCWKVIRKARIHYEA